MPPSGQRSVHRCRIDFGACSLEDVPRGATGACIPLHYLQGMGLVGTRFKSQAMLAQAMDTRNPTVCNTCGRIEQAARGCAGPRRKCSSCRYAGATRHQISFAKLHISHKLPQFLAAQVYLFVHGNTTRRHTKRRLMFARLLQGKIGTINSLTALHLALTPPSTAWHQSDSDIFGSRTQLFNRLTDLVIGPDITHACSWCPWCHGSGCD